MIANLAREDFEDLKAEGLEPTLDDFDRLNCLALRLERGAETTAANFPRVGWAGEVPFFEPTCQAWAWFFQFAKRAAGDDETAHTFLAFACAHARTPGFFSGLETRDAIADAVREWVDNLPVTREEVSRAVGYACCGFDAAVGGTPPRLKETKSEAGRTADERAYANLREKMLKAVGAVGCGFDDLWTETPSHLNAMVYAYHVEQGHEITEDDGDASGAYKFALVEIRKRLAAERDAKQKGGE